MKLKMGAWMYGLYEAYWVEWSKRIARVNIVVCKRARCNALWTKCILSNCLVKCLKCYRRSRPPFMTLLLLLLHAATPTQQSPLYTLFFAILLTEFNFFFSWVEWPWVNHNDVFDVYIYNINDLSDFSSTVLQCVSMFESYDRISARLDSGPVIMVSHHFKRM